MRAREGGASTVLLLLRSEKNNPAAPSQKRPRQQAGKKEGGWGEGIFARLFPAEGGIRMGSGSACALSTEATPAKQFLKRKSRSPIKIKRILRVLLAPLAGRGAAVILVIFSNF